MESSSSSVGKLWRSPAAGGGGGRAFSDIYWPPPASAQVVTQQAKPVEVRVRVGRYVDQVQMRWADRTLPAHGGEGSPLGSLALNGDEYIANVRLTGKRYVGSIEIITNQGRSQVFGTQSGEILDLEVPPNYQVIGFYGQSGRWIDQLGVVAVQVAAQSITSPPKPPITTPEDPSDKLGAIPRVGIELIKEFEGYADALPDGRAKAYADPLLGWKVPTIGYGTTRYPNGIQVKEGDIISRTEAEDYLIEHVDESCRGPLEKIPTWKQMNSNQRGALYSFAYNLGSGFYRGSNFESITRVCDSPERWHDHSWVAAQFVKYRNPGSSVEEGLRRRRLAEADLFCQQLTAATPNWEDDHNEAGEASDRKPEERIERIVEAVAGKQPVGSQLTPDMHFDTLITPHIAYGEFARYEEARRFRHGHQCQTAYDICLFLEKCRAHFGGNPLVITSGYRPPAINASIGGARRSEHLYNAPDTGAVDFYIKNVSVEAVQAWCDQNYPYSIGYGARRGFVHLGVRPGKPRVRWDY